MVLTGTFSVSLALGGAAVVGVVIAAVYMLLPYQRVFTGAPAPERVGSSDLDGRERLVVVPVIAAMLALGLAPGRTHSCARRRRPAGRAHGGPLPAGRRLRRRRR